MHILGLVYTRPQVIHTETPTQKSNDSSKSLFHNAVASPRSSSHAISALEMGHRHKLHRRWLPHFVLNEPE